MGERVGNPFLPAITRVSWVRPVSDTLGRGGLYGEIASRHAWRGGPRSRVQRSNMRKPYGPLLSAAALAPGIGPSAARTPPRPVTRRSSPRTSRSRSACGRRDGTAYVTANFGGALWTSARRRRRGQLPRAKARRRGRWGVRARRHVVFTVTSARTSRSSRSRRGLPPMPTSASTRRRRIPTPKVYASRASQAAPRSPKEIGPGTPASTTRTSTPTDRRRRLRRRRRGQRHPVDPPTTASRTVALLPPTTSDQASRPPEGAGLRVVPSKFRSRQCRPTSRWAPDGWLYVSSLARRSEDGSLGAQGASTR